MVSTLLSEDDARAIERAVAEVERKSATELVVAVVRKSGEYWQFRALFAAGWALGSAVALLHFVPLHPIWAVVAEPVVGLLVYALLGLPALHRLLIPPVAATRAVHARAFAMFSERGLHRTRDRTGLLVFVSELERRVVILGDAGIHERVGDDGWQKHVRHIVDGIREGRAAKGILEAIDELAGILAEVAPRRADDTNELPDALVRE